MFTDEIGVWAHLSEAEKSQKNTMIFMASDKTTKETAAAIAIQASFRGQQARTKGGGGGEPGSKRAPRADSTSEEAVERLKDDLSAAAQHGRT